LRFYQSSSILLECVRIKLKTKSAWGGNTVTLPRRFLLSITAVFQQTRHNDIQELNDSETAGVLTLF
jgi:hypothetical protein